MTVPDGLLACWDSNCVQSYSNTVIINGWKIRILLEG
jgi:hypothetical protein